ncbi:putative glucosidase [Cutibacterium acnes]|nr:putative glucosidase [Cutibacterium acnes]
MDTLMRITDHLTTSPGIQLKIDKRWGASVTFVTRSIAHVRIFDAADPQLDRTWSISLGSNATPRTGLGPVTSSTIPLPRHGRAILAMSRPSRTWR